MVSTGLLAAGYDHLNLDDCWMHSKRNEWGELYGDPKKFPSGMKSIGDYLHGKGLKYGEYSHSKYKGLKYT